MDDWVFIDADPAHVARERERARKLRQSAWWQRKVGKGLCAYCGQRFDPRALTMDHVVAVARGGRSTKGNVLPSCKECNNRKKLLTPAEQLLRAQGLTEPDDGGAGSAGDGRSPQGAAGGGAGSAGDARSPQGAVSEDD